MSADDGPGRREVAVRVFAREFDDATLSYSESDEDRAPSYVALPTGARVNRVFVVGVLTAVESVSDGVLRGRIADPTGAFVCYAGQYQPEAQRFLERADPPAFVAITGKARTFEPEDSDAIYSSIRPETITAVDAATRDRWVVQTAAATLDRCRVASDALESGHEGSELTAWLIERGVDRALAAGLPRAIAHYDLGAGYLQATADLAIDALGVVAGDRDAVEGHSLAPDAPGDRPSIPTIDTPLAVGGFTTPRHAVDASPDAVVVADAPDDAPSEADAATETAADADPGATDSAGAVTADDDSAETSQPEDATAADADTPTSSESPDEDAVAVQGARGTTVEASDAGAETEAADDTSADEDIADDTSVGDADDATTGSGAEESDSGTGTADEALDAVGSDPSDADASEAVTEDGPEFDLDDETRESIESEYGTEFTSGTEVDDPGEAGIETPDPEERAEAESASSDASVASIDADDASEAAPSDTDESSDDDASSADGADDDASDVDLDTAVLEAMDERDDGDGVDRAALIDHVADEAGVDTAAVDDAIEDALMSGQCYEPNEGTLKTI